MSAPVREHSRGAAGVIWISAVGLFLLPWLEFWLMQGVGLALVPAIVWALITGGAGWSFAGREGQDLWTQLESDDQNGRVPTEEGLDAMLVVIGGWALIVPGLLTDALGVALLVPPLRQSAIAPMRRVIRSRWL